MDIDKTTLTSYNVEGRTIFVEDTCLRAKSNLRTASSFLRNWILQLSCVLCFLATPEIQICHFVLNVNSQKFLIPKDWECYPSLGYTPPGYRVLCSTLTIYRCVHVGSSTIKSRPCLLPYCYLGSTAHLGCTFMATKHHSFCKHDRNSPSCEQHGFAMSKPDVLSPAAKLEDSHLNANPVRTLSELFPSLICLPLVRK